MVLQKSISYPTNKEDKRDKLKNIDVRIGERLKEIREIKNLNQTDVADILDISFQQFQKYEKGSNRISFTSVLILAEALNLQLNDLAVDIDESVIGLSDNKQSPITAHANDANASLAETKKIIKLLNSIEDPKTRKYLIKFIEGVVETKPIGNP